ncbi:MAG: cytochrome c biogenesis protein CcdA [Synechococcaceae cyanobacterium SM2_3_1]|nr:cytochrome c biogenesis protein CcdA [Synechococcaceae cyanobacterium SM2_3_1]
MSLIGLAFLAGLVTLLSPCILPILPFLLGRSVQNHAWGPVVMVSGLTLSFALTGSLMGFSAQFLGPLSQGLRQMAMVFLLLLGIMSIFPRWSYFLWQRLRPPLGVQASTHQRGSLGADFIIGTQLGLIWIPCAGPILASIITLIVVDQRIFSGFTALLAYALGAGLPMLGIAYGGKQILHHLRQLYPLTGILQRLAGVAIAIAALGILLGWDQSLQLWLAPLFPPLPL